MDNQPIKFEQLCGDYQRIEEAIHYLDENYKNQPELKEIAERAGLSEFHFQRMFTRWAGISPKRFIQYLTKESAKNILKDSSVLDTTFSVGLSGPGRLHDLFVNTEAVTPGEYKTSGAGLMIRYGFHPTPFGEALIGLTDRGICHLSFVQNNRASAMHNFKSYWNQASLLDEPQSTAAFIEPIFGLKNNSTPISLFLTGTNFQLKVWEALLNIPLGRLTTYGQVASQIGQPGAVRAVGNAIGHNPIAYLIPCHRVIRSMGEFGNYRWGMERKKLIIGWEAALSSNPEPSNYLT